MVCSRQPIERTLSLPASVSLAQAGGFQTARVDRFETDGLLSFETGHVRVSGTEHKEDGGWRTTATATIEGLNILEVVKADAIVAQVSVMHPYGDLPVQISLNGESVRQPAREWRTRTSNTGATSVFAAARREARTSMATRSWSQAFDHASAIC